MKGTVTSASFIFSIFLKVLRKSLIIVKYQLPSTSHVYFLSLPCKWWVSVRRASQAHWDWYWFWANSGHTFPWWSGAPHNMNSNNKKEKVGHESWISKWCPTSGSSSPSLLAFLLADYNFHYRNVIPDMSTILFTLTSGTQSIAGRLTWCCTTYSKLGVSEQPRP